MAGRSFSSNEKVIAAVEGYFADLLECYFKTEIELFEKCWTKL